MVITVVRTPLGSPMIDDRSVYAVTITMTILGIILMAAFGRISNEAYASPRTEARRSIPAGAI
jgi:hypothetical protein